jgi:hypothetical protein
MRFLCNYCNETNSADDSEEGGKMTCCRCGYMTFIPRKTDHSRVVPEVKNQLQIKPGFLRQVLGRGDGNIVFDELNVFVLSLLLVLLLATNADLRETLHKVLISHKNEFIHLSSPREIIGTLFFNFIFGIFLIIFFAGMLLSAVHVFIGRPKNKFEKICMFFFAISTNLAGALNSGQYIMTHATISLWWFLLIIFSGLNIVYCLLLLLYLKCQNEREQSLGEMISARNTTVRQVLTAIAICILMLVVLQYLFKLHWSLTLSICAAYATVFPRSWRAMLSNTQEQEDE